MRRTAALLAAVCLAAIATANHLGGTRAESGLAITQTTLGNVFLEPETPSFTISTTGDAISWSVHDVWNREVAAGGTPIFGVSYRLSLPLALKGWFHLAIKALVAGALLGRQETSFAVLSTMPAVVDSPFGYAAHIGEANPARTFPFLAQAGIKAVRTDLYWSLVEKSPGVYDFSDYAPYLPAMRQQAGASADLILAYNNPFHDGNTLPYSEAGLAAWARFAAAAAGHYKGVAKWVEVYNEYDADVFLSPCRQSPTCYAQMLQYTYPAVKAANPDMTVIGGATVGVNLAWLEKVFQAGGLQHMDVVSVHPSSPSAPEGVENRLAALDALIRKYNGGNPKPIYVTEFGWTTSPSQISVDEPTQARYLVRGQVLTQSAPSVERTFVYCFINDRLSPDDPQWAQGFGSLHSAGDPNGDYTPKPSYVANAVLHRVLLGAHYVEHDSAPSGTRSYRYSDGSHDVHVMWASTPVTVTLHTTSPVMVTDEMGNSTPYPSQNGTVNLPLSSDPLYVAGSIESIS